MENIYLCNDVKSSVVLSHMEHIRFTKMHGLGNDYIYIDCMHAQPERLADLSVEMSDRHCGIGGDGIILILPSEVADFKMRIFNADGSEAMMCGNGSRCVGKYVYDRGLTRKTSITLETLSGIKKLDLHIYNGSVHSVTVDMGMPETSCERIPVKSDTASLVNAPLTLSEGTVNITAVSMGNPHGVVFCDDPATVDLAVVGPELERHPMWPARANIEFVRVDDRSSVTMRVWERGSGETMACGTGACAAVVAAVLNGLCDRRVTVRLLGGDLDVSWDETDGHVRMTGPAVTVFDGRYTRRS